MKSKAIKAKAVQNEDGSWSVKVGDRVISTYWSVYLAKKSVLTINLNCFHQ